MSTEMANTQQQGQPKQTGMALKTDPRQMQFKRLLENENFQTSLKAALPKHIKPSHMIRVVLGAMQQSPKLLECTPESVLLSIMRAASLGLEPDSGVLGHGYLVPFYNGRQKRMECQFIPGYRGLIKLARNSGEVADVWAEVVYAKDHFRYELGLDQTLEHKRNDDVTDAGEVKYAYAVARFKDGEKKFTVMNRREIDAIMKRSSSKDRNGNIGGPWVEHFSEMARKTAVRRLAKYLPLSPDVMQAMVADDDSDIIDGISVPAPDTPELPSADVRGIEDQSGQEEQQEEETPSGDEQVNDSSEQDQQEEGEPIDAEFEQLRGEKATIYATLEKCTTTEELMQVGAEWHGKLNDADKDWLQEQVDKFGGFIKAQEAEQKPAEQKKSGPGKKQGERMFRD